MTPERWSQVRDLLHELLEQNAEERTHALERIALSDPELSREAASLLACEQEADRVLEHTIRSVTEFSPPPASALASLGAYRLIRPLGQGGMGVVWLGERDDGQFTKQVAIKLLPRLYISTGLEARFLRERQILAQMEHPNIARLLDGGVTAEGQPYLVMEYIDGVALTEWAREQRLDVDARVRLFLDVCGAVSYAHRNLIVHRDLKPGNILVNREGQVKLLDFGLARILDQAAPDADLTQTAAPMMTPAYASPEQAQGKPANAASDVFSLGIILYELLAGVRPFGESGQTVAEVIGSVSESEPASPSRVATDRRAARRLEGDLDNIILKALEKHPERRYSSVEAFAQDLRWQQEGRPVSARGTGWAYRTSKFARRNRLSVGIAAAALVAVLAGGGLALREGRRAQRRFNEVRRLAHSVIFDVHDAIAKVPGSTGARAVLVRQGLEYLDRLSAESAGDRGLERELALAYLRLGKVQGVPGGANLGDTRGAKASLEKAVIMLERVHKAAPADRDLAFQLSSAYQDLAMVRDNLRERDEARELLRRARLVVEEELARDPANQQARLQAANTEFYSAEVETAAQRYDEALRLYRDALARYESLKPANVDDDPGHSIALVRKHIGAILIARRDFESALREYTPALDIDMRFAAQHPQDIDAALNPTYAMTDMALALASLGRGDEALTLYHQGLEIRLRLEKMDPQNARVRNSVESSLSRTANAEAQWGDVLANRNRATEAVRHWRAAQNLFAELAKRTQLNEENRRREVRLRYKLALARHD